MKKLLLALFTLFFAVAPAQAEPMPVVASFSILADMVRTVGGEDVAVTTLVGPDADAHAFEPSPADIKAVGAARIVFMNGLGFEGWMERLVQSSGTKAHIVTTTKGITPRAMKDEHGHDHGHAHAHHDHGATDPHAWQNLANAHVYVKNIADALAAALPDKADAIRARATAYDGEITAKDAWVKAQFKDIPKESRLIITSHDAFGYFADAYGIAIEAPEGLSTESEPSAKEIAALIDLIKAKRVKTLFIENMASDRLIRRIAEQTGAGVGQRLYSDALSKAGGGAPTYLSMFQHNVPLMAASMSR